MGGAIEVEMTKAVSQSYLTSLWNQDAFRKSKRDDLNQLTNTYSQRFTKIVVVIALGAAMFWAWANPALSLKALTFVLIVACPCALALAAPFALGTAQRGLARRGVYLKNPYVLETLASVDAVVFDKTGTLTAAGAGNVTWIGREHSTFNIQRPRKAAGGSPSMLNVECFPDSEITLPPHEALSEAEERWLYSMTRHSTHPLAVRIGEAIKREHFPDNVRSFLETAGCGMEGSVAGNEVWMGSAAWLESRNVAVSRRRGDESLTSGSEKLETPHVVSYEEKTGSAVHVAINGKYRGCFVLANALRADAGQVIGTLARDCELALLSGDNEREREQFRTLFGHQAQLRFNQSPLNKLGFIRDLQSGGKTVMMVGDGLNDAGALKQADLGVAVVENISAFSPASDVILSATMISRLAEVRTFARRSVRVVRAAFLISTLYNLVGVGIAASGRLSPVVCAILMPVSSVSVVAFACGATAWFGRKLGGAPASGPALSVGVQASACSPGTLKRELQQAGSATGAPIVRETV